MRSAFTITATDASGTETRIRVTMKTEPGRLTRSEMRNARKVAADQFMDALTRVPHFHPHICDMRVK